MTTGTADLISALAEAGDLDPAAHPAVAAALREVERAAFVPDPYWIEDGDGYVPRRRGDDPAAWATPIYDPSAYIVTQVDDGLTPARGARGQRSSCSLSAPGIVAVMLTRANIHPGDRVLELGAGMGYGTALLAHLAGPGNVTSLEYDTALAAAARKRLADLGVDARILAGDGKHGCPEHGPYHVVISTFSVRAVPSAWLTQATPGARIVTPLNTTFYPYGLLTLTADGAGGGGTGTLIDDANFITDRDHRPFRGNPRRFFWDQPAETTTTTTLSPAVLREDHAALCAIGVQVPGAYHWTGRYPEPEHATWFTWWIYDTHGSWAAVDYRPDAHEYPVEQTGPRRLWDELETAHHHWADAGSPPINAFTYIAEPGGTQHVDFPAAIRHAAPHPLPNTASSSTRRLLP